MCSGIMAAKELNPKTLALAGMRSIYYHDKYLLSLLRIAYYIIISFLNHYKNRQ